MSPRVAADWPKQQTLHADQPNFLHADLRTNRTFCSVSTAGSNRDFSRGRPAANVQLSRSHVFLRQRRGTKVQLLGSRVFLRWTFGEIQRPDTGLYADAPQRNRRRGNLLLKERGTPDTETERHRNMRPQKLHFRPSSLPQKYTRARKLHTPPVGQPRQPFGTRRSSVRALGKARERGRTTSDQVRGTCTNARCGFVQVPRTAPHHEKKNGKRVERQLFAFRP